MGKDIKIATALKIGNSGLDKDWFSYFPCCLIKGNLGSATAAPLASWPEALWGVLSGCIHSQEGERARSGIGLPSSLHSLKVPEPS